MFPFILAAVIGCGTPDTSAKPLSDGSECEAFEMPLTPVTEDIVMVWAEWGGEMWPPSPIAQAELVIYADGTALFRDRQAGDFMTAHLDDLAVARIVEQTRIFCSHGGEPLTETGVSSSSVNVLDGGTWRRTRLRNVPWAGASGTSADKDSNDALTSITQELRSANPQPWRPAEVDIGLTPYTQGDTILVKGGPAVTQSASAWPSTAVPRPEACGAPTIIAPSASVDDFLRAQAAVAGPLVVDIGGSNCFVTVEYELPKSSRITEIIRMR